MVAGVPDENWYFSMLHPEPPTWNNVVNNAIKFNVIDYYAVRLKHIRRDYNVLKCIT